MRQVGTQKQVGPAWILYLSSFISFRTFLVALFDTLIC